MITLLLLITLTAPDAALTPGVVRPLPLQVLCTTKWGKDHRAVTRAMKQEVFRRYGIDWQEHAAYEVDHLVPRELAGADVVENLWPQLWAEAIVKDHRENVLHRAVCAGTVTLADAQAEMRGWGRRDVAQR